MSMQMGMEQDHSVQMLHRAWEANPFDNLVGGQNLEILTTNRGASLQGYYKRHIRQNIIDLASLNATRGRTTEEDKTVVIVLEGPSGAGKSGVGQSFRRLLLQDLYLHNRLNKLGRELGIRTFIYGQGLVAAQEEIFTEEGKIARQVGKPLAQLRRLIEPKQMGTFSEQEYALTSEFMWDQLNIFFMGNTSPRRINVIIYEGNIDTGFPLDMEPPYRTLNYDRGTSILTRFTTDSRTKDSVHVLAFERDEEVFNEAVQKRKQERATIEQGEEKLKVDSNETILVETKPGEFTPFEELPLSLQRSIIEFRLRTQNSPEGMEIATYQMYENWQKVSERLKVPITNAEEWHKVLRRTLKIPQRRFNSVKNSYMSAMIKTFDMGYLVDHSIMVDQVSEIWKPKPKQRTVPAQIADYYVTL